MNREHPELHWPNLSNFKIIRQVARGGMGIVYEADQLSLGRRVALKTLALDRDLGENAEARFQMEAQSAARLHHSNIVPVFEVGHEDGVSFYAMQYIEGLGLEQVSRQVTYHLGSTRKPARQRDTVPSKRKKTPDRPAAPQPGTAGLGETRPDQSDELGLADKLAESLIADTVGHWSDTPADNTRHPAGRHDETRPHPSGSGPAGDPSDFELASAVVDVAAGDSSSSGKPPITVTRFRDYCQRIADIGQQVASGLDYAHQRGVIHRDIKPSNLLLDINGSVWITDFGLAKLEESDLTHSGGVVGTTRFISPERFEGQCDSRSDIYALGITLYEMLLLRPAFQASERASLLEKIRTSQPARLQSVEPRIPLDLATIVEKAIERDPARRYQTAGEMQDDLLRFMDNRPIRARKVTPLGQVTRWAQRNRLVASLLFALALGLVALATVSTLAANSFRNQASIERQRADTEAALRAQESKLLAQETEARETAQNVRDFIVQSFGSPNRDEDGKTITVYAVLKREAANIPAAYEDDPLSQAVLFQAIGDSFHALTEYPDAIAALEQSLELYEQAVGETDRRAIDCMTSLVDVFVSDQQAEKSIEMAQRVWELTMAHHSDDEEYCMAAENNLASAYFTDGQDDLAAPMFEAVLERMRRLFGSHDENTLDAMYNLIQTYHWLSREQEERALAAEFLQVSQEMYDDNSLEVAKAREIFAISIPDGEQPELVGQYRQDVFDIRMAQLGPEHHLTMDALSGLAKFKMAAGESDEALQLFQQHFDSCVAKFGELHRSTVASATSLGAAHAQTGDELAAIEWLERALANGRQVDPEHDPNLLNTKQGLAWYTYKNGNKQRALELNLDIFENGFSVNGFQSSRVKNALQTAIITQQELELHEEALVNARRFHDLVSQLDEPKPYRVVGANAALAVSLYDNGQYSQALPYCDAAINVPLEGDGFPRGVVRAQFIKGLIQLRDDDPDNDAEAQSLLDESFAQLESELPNFTPPARWIVRRACQRAIEVFTDLSQPDDVETWTSRLSTVNEQLELIDGD